MNAVVIALVIAWMFVLGLVLCRLLELDLPVIGHVNAFMDGLFGTPGSQP